MKKSDQEEMQSMEEATENQNKELVENMKAADAAASGNTLSEDDLNKVTGGRNYNRILKFPMAQ